MGLYEKALKELEAHQKRMVNAKRCDLRYMHVKKLQKNRMLNLLKYYERIN